MVVHKLKDEGSGQYKYGAVKEFSFGCMQLFYEGKVYHHIGTGEDGSFLYSAGITADDYIVVNKENDNITIIEFCLSAIVDHALN